MNAAIPLRQVRSQRQSRNHAAETPLLGVSGNLRTAQHSNYHDRSASATMEVDSSR